jgi:hypothetical protein
MDARLRELVRERADHRCEYCRLPQSALPWARFHIEHIRAQQHGGSDDLANLALACRRCNGFKGPNLTAIDPATDAIVPLFNPRQDRWREHFAVEDLHIVGLTDVGRATAALLNMNDPDRLQLRSELTALGELY